MSLLLSCLAVTALAVASLPAQDSVVYPPDRADQRPCNVIPFGSFTKYPFPENQKYEVLVPWTALAALSRPVIEDLGFWPCADGVQHFAAIRIRLAQTKLAALTEVFATNLGAAPVTVLDATDYYWHRKKGAWSRVGFQRPFTLQRGLDLVVDIEVRGGVFLRPDFTSSDTDVGGFASSRSFPRLFALDWKQTPPARGRLHTTAGLRMELASRASDLGIFGIGCKGTGSLRPALTLSGLARPAGVVRVALAHALPNNPTLLVLGFDSRPPYPIALGLGGCRLYQSLDLGLAAVTDANGKLTVPVPLPAANAIRNQRFYGQFFQVELSARKLGLRGSNYGRVLVR